MADAFIGGNCIAKLDNRWTSDVQCKGLVMISARGDLTEWKYRAQASRIYWWIAEAAGILLADRNPLLWRRSLNQVSLA
jgi:phage terminase Nu1 subunit (DNA packaging protein)